MAFKNKQTKKGTLAGKNVSFIDPPIWCELPTPQPPLSISFHFISYGSVSPWRNLKKSNIVRSNKWNKPLWKVISFRSTPYNWGKFACGLAARNFHLPEPTGTMAWWIWYISSDMVAFTRRGFFMLFCGPRWVGYEHVVLFLPSQSVVNFFLCLGQIIIETFSSSVTTKRPARLSIRSTSLMLRSCDRCCPELTPRLRRCLVTSDLHANRGTIWDPVPSKLQTESGELNEQLNSTFMM